jgi:uncharacterized protein
MIEAIGTYLPVWGSGSSRVAGDDEDVVTMAVAAGLRALDSSTVADVSSVVLVSRDLPVLVPGSGAALLAGLSLPAGTDVREQVGGGPAALEAVASAPSRTLVIGADVVGGSGAAAVLTGETGAGVTVVARTNRSLPVYIRDASGHVSDYADPRLLRELGVKESLVRAGVAGRVDAVAGMAEKDAASLAEPGSALPQIPTRGASAPLFALAAVCSGLQPGRLLAVEQATVSLAEVDGALVRVSRDERPATPPVRLREPSEADISISLAAYERAFDAKLRLEADRCVECGTLAYPHRFRCISCGAEGKTETVPLPRDAEIYSLATIHIPVPGLATPYTVVLVNLGESGVRLLGRLTGAPPGSIGIGDRGRMVLRRVAIRNGVPDYGYAFLPTVDEEVAA